MYQNPQNIFIIGAKSLGLYGGYETFVNKLTEYHQDDPHIKYHVACKANGEGYMDETMLTGITDIVKNKNGKVVEFTYHNARCFKIDIPDKLGSAQAIYYDIKSLNVFLKYIRDNKIDNPIVYILACRIGPFIEYYYKKIHALGGKLFINPDGHEWKRSKWSMPVRRYWKKSEQLMVKWSDLVICDSINIEKYIHENYDGKGINEANPNTTYIAYGAETGKSILKDSDESIVQWYEQHNVKPHEYFLIVGRFVPENNYETMIREFMKSNTDKSLVIVTNVNDKFYSILNEKLYFENDQRVKFVGTVYNQELLKKIRENAWAYIHGHEVGGTNPSLLEALGSTDVNMLLDVGFNREVADDAALYWNKDKGNLMHQIQKCDNADRDELGKKAKERIEKKYSWQRIADMYLEEWSSWA